MRVFTLWKQGVENAPPCVKYCISKWGEIRNIHFDVFSKAYADDKLKEYGVNPEQLPVQVYSDLFRLCELNDGGGIWVDATVLPSEYFVEWFEQNILGSDVFMFSLSDQAKGKVAANWFIVSEKNNCIINKWLKLYITYWVERTRLPISQATVGEKIICKIFQKYAPLRFVEKGTLVNKINCFPYFICHYHLTYLINNDEKVKNIWSVAPKFDAKESFSIQKNIKNSIALSQISVCDSPVYKLDKNMSESEVLAVKRYFSDYTKLTKD